MDPDITQPNPTTTTESNQPSTNAVPPGVQARFDELTATIHEQRRIMEQSNSANQELIAQLAATALRNNQPQQPAPQTLPEGVDPVLADYLSKQFTQAMSHQFAQFEQKIGQTLGGVRQSQEQMEFQAAAQGTDPRVVQEAQKLMSAWKKQGFTGWRPEDAITFAEGQVARQSRSSSNRLRPNGDGNDATIHGGTAMPSTQSKLPPAKSEEELRRMSADDEMKYWASRVGDSDIVY